MKKSAISIAFVQAWTLKYSKNPEKNHYCAINDKYKCEFSLSQESIYCKDAYQWQFSYYKVIREAIDRSNQPIFPMTTFHEYPAARGQY